MVSSVESPQWQKGQLYTLISLRIPADTMLLRKWVCQGLALRFHMWLVGMPVNEYHDWMTAKKRHVVVVVVVVVADDDRVDDHRVERVMAGSGLRSRDRQTTPHMTSKTDLTNQCNFLGPLQIKKRFKVADWTKQRMDGQPLGFPSTKWPARLLRTFRHGHVYDNPMDSMSFLLLMASKQLLLLLHTRCIKKAGRTSYLYIRKHIDDLNPPSCSTGFPNQHVSKALHQSLLAKEL